MGRKNGKEQTEVNNNSHVCNEPKTKLENGGASLMDSSLSADEIALVWDFYVSHASVRKDQNDKGNGAGLRCLADYGWSGSSALSSLKQELMKATDLERIVVIRADEITKTLNEMNLTGEICWKHPRAVVKQLFSVKVEENGECNVKPKESEMVCFFRHIRNALAHNRLYYSTDGKMILLEDMDNQKITAKILIPVVALINWIKIIDKDKRFYPGNDDVSDEIDLKIEEAS